MLRVFIIDDHPFVREGLKTFLNTQTEIEICGEAGDAETALPQMIAARPDIAIIDLHLPGKGGIQLTKALKEAGLMTKIIILSSFCEDDEVLAALEVGALSYLMKDSPPQKLLEAIFAARNDEPVLHPRIAKKLIQKMNRPPEPLIEPLTAKEKEVLAKLVKGKSNKEIAAELAISDTTVKTHVSSILHKLAVNDRTQAVIKAMELKLI